VIDPAPFARHLLLAVSSFAIAFAARAQAPAAAPPLTCAEDLQLLHERVRANYAGYTLEFTGDKLRRFEAAFDSMRTRAEGTAGVECVFVLKRLIRWFDDPHLFLYETGRLDTAETARRARDVAIVDIDEARARAYFAAHAATLDAIEGIWYDGALRMAVVPEPGAAAGRFVAVLLNSDSSIWRPGAVRARFARTTDGAYDVELWNRNYSLRHLDGAIYKHVLLRVSPGMWGKAFPVAESDRGLLDPTDVHRPTLIARNGTVIVSIPSHDGPYKRVLDDLIAEHASDLKNAARLIVDLRGNEGGGSGMSNALLPYIASAHQRPSILKDADAVMLSSDDQIAYARSAFGPDTSRFVRGLLARMQAHRGEFVPLSDPEQPPEAPPADSVIVGPRRVGVLVDRGTVSASEVLVLNALRSERATVFGEPTAGALDYQSTSIVAFSPRERRWFLGYPTITRNLALPSGGMRGVGIAPNVRMDLARVADPIAFVERALSRAP
jgi:hypothetical protein